SATPIEIVKAKTVAIENVTSDQWAKGAPDTTEEATGEWRPNAFGFGRGREGDGRSTECINPSRPVQYRGGKPPYGLSSRSLNKRPVLPPNAKEDKQARRAEKKHRKSVRSTQEEMKHLRQSEARYWKDDIFRARVDASSESVE